MGGEGEQREKEWDDDEFSKMGECGDTGDLPGGVGGMGQDGECIESASSASSESDSSSSSSGGGGGGGGGGQGGGEGGGEAEGEGIRIRWAVFGEPARQALVEILGLPEDAVPFLETVADRSLADHSKQKDVLASVREQKVTIRAILPPAP